MRSTFAFALAVALILIANNAWAQVSSEKWLTFGNEVRQPALSGVSRRWQLAGGGEGIVRDRLGVGGEVGFTVGGGSLDFEAGLLGTVHLAGGRTREWLDPFIRFGQEIVMSEWGVNGGLRLEGGASLGHGTHVLRISLADTIIWPRTQAEHSVLLKFGITFR